ncbi:MAG: CPBP family intramembrane metalloprotease [Clostridiales bacterium]|jgi:membrane protease YdiL (CAAX protease family)|nr:CPBP family intramembrane metalloprotease [Clostridiales bacterium]
MLKDKRTAADISVFCVYIALMLLNMFFYLGAVKLSDNATERIFTVLSQVVCMGILPFFLFRAFNKDSDIGEHISLRRPKGGTMPKILLIALMMIFINMTISVINYIALQIFGFSAVSSAGTIYNGYGTLFLDLILTAMLPAVFEEFTFRGVVLGAYKDSPIAGIIISSLLFALMHTNVLQFLYAFVGGVVMAVLVIKTRSIIASSIIHFAINAFSVLRSYGYQYASSPANILNVLLDFLLSPAFIIIFFAGVVFMAVAVVRILKKIDADDPVDLKAKAPKRPFGSNAFLAGAIVFGTLMTVFTFVWGVAR